MGVPQQPIQLCSLITLLKSIAKATGQLPNAILMGMTAWRRFRNNAKVIEKQPGAALIGLNQGQASAMLINPSMEIRLSTMAYDTTKEGKTRKPSVCERR